MKKTVWLCLLLGGVFATVLVWNRNVEIRLPTGFRGLVRVTVGDSGTVPKNGFLKLIINVPPSGEVTLRSLGVLRRWHRQTAYFSDGSRLDLSFPDDPREGVAFHIMNVPPMPQLYYFVGTSDELAAFLEQQERNLYAVPAT